MYYYKLYCKSFLKMYRVVRYFSNIQVFDIIINIEQNCFIYVRFYVQGK